MKRWMIVAVNLLLVMAWPALTSAQTLRAFVGSASKPAMIEAATAFEIETGIHVELDFGGSGSMLSQMILSNRGDLYCPGSPDYMELAIAKQVVDPQTVRVVSYLVPAINVAAGISSPQETAEAIIDMITLWEQQNGTLPFGST